MTVDIDPKLLEQRTEQQVLDGKLANGKLDPRGYTVTCPRLCQGKIGGCGGDGQWWGTPDNLPIRHADCDRDGCPLRA